MVKETYFLLTETVQIVIHSEKLRIFIENNDRSFENIFLNIP